VSSPPVILNGTNLKHGFGQGGLRAEVLHGVNLELRRGEILLIMGPSGSGKSTLLAILAGLLRPESGSVMVQGTDLWALSPAERKAFRFAHLGFIFQGFNLFATLTLNQQLEIILTWGAGMTRQESRAVIAAMLEQLDLHGKGDLRPPHLSGGEKQRAAVARGLLQKPAICFADEPTSALDWGHGQEVIRLFREAAFRSGTAVLIVSHDVRIRPWADRVLLLEDGRLTPGPDDPDAGRRLSLHHDKPIDTGGKDPSGIEDRTALAPVGGRGKSR
jgi:putative ABC transport system ATP-binding protein